MVTAGRLQEVHHALDLVKDDPRLFTTAGCHPTRCQEMLSAPRDASKWDRDLGPADDGRVGRYIAAIESLINTHKGKIVAVGECGLDYDRLHFCPRDVQIACFEAQFDLAERSGLPMFLHDRNTGTDFVGTNVAFFPLFWLTTDIFPTLDMVRRHRGRFSGGVVHSFTGTWAEAEELLGLGLSLGVNGCSLKTEENLQVAARIPAERLMLETDGPWCSIKATHASAKHVRTKLPTCKKEKFVAGQAVRDRCEPAHITQVLEVLAAIRGVDEDVLAAQCYDNTMKMFFA